jgi:hypothetical protein
MLDRILLNNLHASYINQQWQYEGDFRISWRSNTDYYKTSMVFHAVNNPSESDYWGCYTVAHPLSLFGTRHSVSHGLSVSWHFHAANTLSFYRPRFSQPSYTLATDDLVKKIEYRRHCYVGSSIFDIYSEVSGLKFGHRNYSPRLKRSVASFFSVQTYEVDSCWAYQNLSLILKNLHVRSCIHNPPPLIPTVSEVKPMYKLRSNPLSYYLPNLIQVTLVESPTWCTKLCASI